jgi:secretion/DNA translocation related TadE-like protein
MTVAGLVVGAAVLTVGLTAVGAGAVASQRVAAAADGAALAAADAASGAVPGVPCARAAEVAEAGGARLADCILEGLIATVTVEAEVFAWTSGATARAGPPPAPG